MKLETLFQFFETYVNRRRIKRFTNRLDKLPYWIAKANLPMHTQVQLEKTFKLIILQLFKPKTKQERRDFLKK